MHNTKIWMINETTTRELVSDTYEVDASIISEISWRGRLKKKIVEKIIKVLKEWHVLTPYYMSKTCMDYPSVEVSYDQVEKKIWENKQAIMMLWNKEVDYIVMGAKDIAELKSVEDFRFPNNYRSSFARSFSDGKKDERLSYLGVTVRLIPGWDGIFCVPKANNPPIQESQHPSVGDDWRYPYDTTC